MSLRDYRRQTERRIARMETETNATILRAFTRMISFLEKEKNEYLIRLERSKKRVRRAARRPA